MNVNSSKLLSKTGNDLQATNLAEMGATHIKEEVFSILQENNEKTLAETELILEQNLPFNFTFQVKAETNPFYIIKSSNIPADVSKVEDEKTETIIVYFSSYGYSNDQQEKNITGMVRATRAKGSIFPTAPDGTIHFYDDAEWTKDDDDEIDNVYFHEGVTMSSNSDLQVNYNLYSEGTTTLESNSDLIVFGDAYVQLLDVKTNSNPGNLGLMCVENTLYIYGDPTVNLGIKTSFTNCTDVKAATPAKNGIYAKNYLYVSPSTGGTGWEKGNLNFDTIKYE